MAEAAYGVTVVFVALVELLRYFIYQLYCSMSSGTQQSDIDMLEKSSGPTYMNHTIAMRSDYWGSLPLHGPG